MKDFSKMNLFYAPYIVEPVTTLTEDESKHIVRVLRKSEGDIVFFTDGLGFIYKCVIKEANPKKCLIEIVEKTAGRDKRNFRLHIAIAPTKNITRFEWFLEKSTEIGIDNITPLLCTRSERKHINIKRSKKIILSAMKQSITTILPEIHEMVSIKSFLKNLHTGNAFMAYCDSNKEVHLKSQIHPAQKYTVLIGPEGGFSPEEVQLAKEKDVQLVGLGTSRFRTETAGIIACHTISLCNEET